MAEDNKLVVQIVLDDGSVVKGFANIEKQAEKTAKESSDSLSDIEKNFSVDGIINKIKGIHPAVGGAIAVLTAALAGVGAAFNSALGGEKLEAMEKNFNSIAAAAGLSGKAIQDGLEIASQGMFDFSDNVGIVNGAILELGASAAKLPMIMEIARKSAAATGGDFAQNFETIVKGIESGNTKLLKQAGIYIDSEAAVKKYAAALGVSASTLDQAQKQQAILNEVLSVGEKKFKDVSTSTKPMEDAMKRIAVAWNEIKESAEKAANSAFGKFFADGLERVASALGSTSSKSSVLKRDVAELEQEIKKLNEAVSKPDITTRAKFELEFHLKKISEELNAKKAELKTVNEEISSMKSSAESPIVETAKPTTGLNKAQLDEINKARNDAMLMQLESNNQLISAEANKANQILNIESRSYEQRRLLQEQQQNDLETHLFTLESLKTKYDMDSIAGQIQYNAAVAAENNKYRAKEIQNESKLAEMKKAEKAREIQAAGNFFGTLAGLQDSGSRELFEIGKASAIASATMNAYQAINKTLAEGGAWAIPQAVAIGVMAFANVAKIAATNFGEKTTAPASFGGAAGGGGINAGISTPVESPAIANNDIQKQEPQTKIEVNFAGNNLNTRESSLHIVELLNEAFEQHGAIVKGAV